MEQQEQRQKQERHILYAVGGFGLLLLGTAVLLHGMDGKQQDAPPRTAQAAESGRLNLWQQAEQWPEQVQNGGEEQVFQMPELPAAEPDSTAASGGADSVPAAAEQGQDAGLSAHPDDEELNRRALAGDAQAQFMIARYYKQRKEWDKAVPWLERAAAQGDAKAQNNLAYAYVEGLGSARNPERACALFEQIAQKSNSWRDWENTGLCYDQELKQYGKAFSAYRHAAGQDAPAAMRVVGTLYWQGEGVKQDRALGEYWLRRAALKNDARALYSLSVIYMQNKGKRTHDHWVAGYMLAKAAQHHLTNDDREVMEKTGFPDKLIRWEKQMPDHFEQIRQQMEVLVRKHSTAELLAEIDRRIPYTEPQQIP